MARFLICSFALVLLYPSGIDMYLDVDVWLISNPEAKW